MEYIGKLITLIFNFLMREFTLYGYTFSYFGIMVFCAVATLLAWFIWEFLGE